MLGFVNAPRTHYSENEYGLIWLSNGILHIQYKPVVVNTDAVEKMIGLKLQSCNGKDFPLLIDGRAVKYWTFEARKLSNNHPDSFKNLTAAALLTSTHITSILANWFIQFMRPPLPIKHFSDEEKALRWLAQFKA